MPNEELQGLERLRVIGNYVQRRKLTSHDIRELALDLENHSNSFYQLPSSPKMEKALKSNWLVQLDCLLVFRCSGASSWACSLSWVGRLFFPTQRRKWSIILNRRVQLWESSKV